MVVNEEALRPERPEDYVGSPYDERTHSILPPVASSNFAKHTHPLLCQPFDLI